MYSLAQKENMRLLFYTKQGRLIILEKLNQKTSFPKVVLCGYFFIFSFYCEFLQF